MNMLLVTDQQPLLELFKLSTGAHAGPQATNVNIISGIYVSEFCCRVVNVGLSRGSSKLDVYPLPECLPEGTTPS